VNFNVKVFLNFVIIDLCFVRYGRESKYKTSVETNNIKVSTYTIIICIIKVLKNNPYRHNNVVHLII